MTTLRQSRHSRFQHGSGVFNCSICGRSTRITHQENDRLCAECWDLAGEENSLSDTGELYDANAVDILNRCVERGGSVERLLREFSAVCEHIGWTGPTSKTLPATEEKKETKTMFNLTITSERGLSFSAIVAASSPAEAIREGRAAVREAGISRSVGTIHYRAKKAR